MTGLATTDGTALTWSPRNGTSLARTAEIVCGFLDTATTSFGRATHYNTREEQQVAELAAHEQLLGLERDLYALMLMLPGVTDRSHQVGLKNLLGSPRQGNGSFLDDEQELHILYTMTRMLPAQRMIKTMEAFRVGDYAMGIRKANNARTRRLVLRTLLNSSKLQWWSVKYRRRLRGVFTHVWGRQMTTVMRDITGRSPERWNAKEHRIVRSFVVRHLKFHGNVPRTLECIAFVLGATPEEGFRSPLLKAFFSAKEDLSQGKRLPPEVLEGLRSTYHAGTEHAEVLKMTAKSGSMTKGQRLSMQKEAEDAGVKVDVDLRNFTASRLYIYAFERGLTDELIAQMDLQAEKAAKAFPMRFSSLGIIVDASASMAGDRTQKLRPMAGTLALRDMLRKTAERSMTQYVGGSLDERGLVHPQGDTSLAEALVDALTADPAPEAVFVLSDGYENAPAGRFAETVEAVRKIGNQTPIYHLNPVFAAEASGVRQLSPGVRTMPVQEPAQLGVSFLRSVIETDPLKGVNALVGLAFRGEPALLEVGRA